LRRYEPLEPVRRCNPDAAEMIGFVLEKFSQRALGVPISAVLQSPHSILKLFFRFERRDFTSVG
jgi:hypothetical protein